MSVATHGPLVSEFRRAVEAALQQGISNLGRKVSSSSGWGRHGSGSIDRMIVIAVTAVQLSLQVMLIYLDSYAEFCCLHVLWFTIFIFLALKSARFVNVWLILHEWLLWITAIVNYGAAELFLSVIRSVLYLLQTWCRSIGFLGRFGGRYTKLNLLYKIVVCRPYKVIILPVKWHTALTKNDKSDVEFKISMMNSPYAWFSCEFVKSPLLIKFCQWKNNYRSF